MWKRSMVFGGLFVVLVGLSLSSTAGSHEGRGGGAGVFEISVTNITKGQILSPPVVAIHNSGAQNLFELGQPASHELYQIAEDAVNDDMITALSNDPNVLSVAEIFGVNGPILPGETASIEVAAGGGYGRVSLVGMLVTTNDAFYGLNHAQLSIREQERRSPAYDAGSEFNNELCEFIPGPPCDNPGVRDTDGAEGFVHIHSGIHGIGDLAPAELDWRNSVAQIRVRRMP